MSTHSFDPRALTQRWRGLRAWWPSARLGKDPLEDVRIDGRYAPVSIANWKLIPPVAKGLLAQRVPQPLTFRSDQRLTVVIPFRDRQMHLGQLLPVLTAVLGRQGLNANVLVVEQEAGGLFNRGRLLNAGMHYAADHSDYFCLHDVDAVPVNADYRCPSQPLRLVNRIVTEEGVSSRTGYYFSGAVSVRQDQAFAANGFSNDYWGWGKEDDDFFFRLLAAGYLCYLDLEGEFQDLPNPCDQQVRRDQRTVRAAVKANRRKRSRLLRGLDDVRADGLDSLRYEVTNRARLPDHEKITIRW